MKTKTPWKPKPPKKALKCYICFGNGMRQYVVDMWGGTITRPCDECGGKGFK